MHCPFCNHPETKVIDSRLAGEGAQVRRRRECLACEDRFTTFESAELWMPRVVKGDGSRVPFDEEKLRRGIQRALEKRPVDTEAVDAALNRIIQGIRDTGEREIPSREIGELVMAELRALDQVAYVRFASVYRSFEDVEAFRREIEALESEPGPEARRHQLTLLPDMENGGKGRRKRK